MFTYLCFILLVQVHIHILSASYLSYFIELVATSSGCMLEDEGRKVH